MTEYLQPRYPQPQRGLELGDTADKDWLRVAGAILLECGIKNGARRPREHEIALLDAGGEELGRIFAGHLYACTDLQ